MINLTEFRPRAKGFADLLTYAGLVDEGVILNKDGSFLSAAQFRGPDMASSANEELAVMRVQINTALKKLGSGWLLNVDVVRVAAQHYPSEADNHFADPVSALIDAERRAQYEQEGRHYESLYVLSLSYQPPGEVMQRVTNMFVTAERERDGSRRASSVDYSVILARYQEQVRGILDNMASTLQIKQLSSDELLSYLNLCISGRRHPVRTPAVPFYLDAVLGSKDFATGFAPRVGDKYVRAISIYGFPSETLPGCLDQAGNLPFEYRWSTRYIALDRLDADSRLKVFRKKWFNARGGLLALAMNKEPTRDNGDAARMEADADQAINENSSDLVRYGYYTSTIVIFADTQAEAEECSRQARKLLENSGYPCYEETVNAVEAYLGSLPAHGYYNVRRPLVSSAVLADLMPTTAVWTGHEHHPAPADMIPPKSPPLMYAATDGTTPFRLNLHVGDLGATAVLGPPGAGKSTLLAMITAQYQRYRNAQVFAFDFGYSMSTLCQASGGEHYDIRAEGSGPAFCPLGELDTAADRAWATAYIETLVALRLPPGEALSVKQVNEIAQSVEVLAKGTSSASQRTLTDIRTTIQDEAISEALNYYTLDGPLGRLLDHGSDSLVNGSKARFYCFELSHLMDLGDKAIIPVMLHIFRQVEKRVGRGIPTIIPIDEAWKTFGHPVALERLKAWLKMMRKENAPVLLATQNLTDLLDSPIAPVLLDNIATKILLPNPEAITENVSPVYRSFGLNDRQIRNLALAVKKRDYYLMNSDGRRMFSLDLKSVALAFTAASGKDQHRLVQELRSKHGDGWVVEYLRLKRVAPDWISYYETLRDRFARSNESENATDQLAA